MHELQIHHLPVIDHDKLVGLVSDRDLSSIVVDDRVADVMTTDVAVVAANAPLDEVIGLMSLGRFSSVVVMGTDGIEGIFTTTDALRAFAELLDRLRPRDGSTPAGASNNSLRGSLRARES